MTNERRTRLFRPAARPGAVPALLLAWLLLGCKGGDGLSDYERMKQKQGDAAAALRRLGAKVTEKQYFRMREAWSVDLSGMPVTDELLAHLKALGRIAELDLSRSTVTDDHLPRVNAVEVGGFLLKLDLSHTAVTDAGLDRLDHLGVLQSLNLTGTKATAAGVDRFKKRRQDNPKVLTKTPNVLLN